MLPKDPIMLLSYVNTQLRDNCNSLDEFCQNLNVSTEIIISKLASVDYEYNEEQNRFI